MADGLIADIRRYCKNPFFCRDEDLRNIVESLGMDPGFRYQKDSVFERQPAGAGPREGLDIGFSFEYERLRDIKGTATSPTPKSRFN